MKNKETFLNSTTNKTIIECLKKINPSDWEGNTTYKDLKNCLVALNLGSGDSGFYIPTVIKIDDLNGFFIINQSNTIYFDSKIVKISEDKYLIQRLKISAINEFEKKYSEMINKYN